MIQNDAYFFVRKRKGRLGRKWGGEYICKRDCIIAKPVYNLNKMNDKEVKKMKSK